MKTRSESKVCTKGRSFFAIDSRLSPLPRKTQANYNTSPLGQGEVVRFRLTALSDELDRPKTTSTILTPFILFSLYIFSLYPFPEANFALLLILLHGIQNQGKLLAYEAMFRCPRDLIIASMVTGGGYCETLPPNQV